ncbi:hypothetical protein MHYP_G00064410 [Metynnis hypsauchen]
MILCLRVVPCHPQEVEAKTHETAVKAYKTGTGTAAEEERKENWLNIEPLFTSLGITADVNLDSCRRQRVGNPGLQKRWFYLRSSVQSVTNPSLKKNRLDPGL